jgi:hypothetical protein
MEMFVPRFEKGTPRGCKSVGLYSHARHYGVVPNSLGTGATLLSTFAVDISTISGMLIILLH